VVLVEYGAAGAGGLIRAAYAEAGGPGRVEDPTGLRDGDRAALAHPRRGCRRWLAAATDAERADNEGWVREFVDQPLTRDGSPRSWPTEPPSVQAPGRRDREPPIKSVGRARMTQGRCARPTLPMSA
jgi:hypothetical protein